MAVPPPFGASDASPTLELLSRFGRRDGAQTPRGKEDAGEEGMEDGDDQDMEQRRSSATAGLQLLPEHPDHRRLHPDLRSDIFTLHFLADQDYEQSSRHLRRCREEIDARDRLRSAKKLRLMGSQSPSRFPRSFLSLSYGTVNTDKNTGAPAAASPGDRLSLSLSLGDRGDGLGRRKREDGLMGRKRGAPRDDGLGRRRKGAAAHVEHVDAADNGDGYADKGAGILLASPLQNAESGNRHVLAWADESGPSRPVSKHADAIEPHALERIAESDGDLANMPSSSSTSNKSCMSTLQLHEGANSSKDGEGKLEGEGNRCEVADAHQPTQEEHDVHLNVERESGHGEAWSKSKHATNKERARPQKMRGVSKNLARVAASDILQHHPNSSDKRTIFAKELYKSDVDPRQDRLLISKKFKDDFGVPDPAFHGDKTLHIIDEDDGQVMNFLYGYWNSSSSYIFKTGWKLYRLKKQLDIGDTVFVYMDGRDGSLSIRLMRKSNTSS